MSDKPATYNSELTEERIIELAQFIINIRGEVIERHDEEYLGDTRLSLGMRAYECCRTRLIAQAEKNVWSWFSILTPEQRFTFAIENTPIRFARIEPNSLPFKKLIRSEEALKQLSLFDDDISNTPIHWFIVIDTYYLNASDSVYFVGYNEAKEIICQWEIPIEEDITSLTDVNYQPPQAVELEKAKLTLRKKPIPKINKNEK